MPAALRSNSPHNASFLAVVGPLMSAVVALACLSVGWWIIFHARIGPVVATITAGHGVHTGDVFGLCAVALSLGFGTRAYTSVRRPERSLALVPGR